MCLGCDLENGEFTRILSNKATDFVVNMEIIEGHVKLHMTDGEHHTTRDIYHCPFCGRNLEKAR